MKFPSSTSFALLGAALIAISFGLARFAFGLFVPPIRAELELSPDMIGIIGALPLISFILATLIAPLAADRLGARNTAVLSGGFGAVGLVLISQASGVLSLGVGVVACGICTGLMMPALTAAMQALMLMMLSASLALLAASPGNIVIAVFSALVFGLAYMSLTGLYLMTGIRLLPGRLSVGPVLPFISVSLGQAIGSPIVGMLVNEFSYADAFAMFAAIGILAALLSPLYPRSLEQGAEEQGEDETGLQAAYDYQLQTEEGEPYRAVKIEAPSEGN